GIDLLQLLLPLQLTENPTPIAPIWEIPLVEMDGERLLNQFRNGEDVYDPTGRIFIRKEQVFPEEFGTSSSLLQQPIPISSKPLDLSHQTIEVLKVLGGGTFAHVCTCIWNSGKFAIKIFDQSI